MTLREVPRRKVFAVATGQQIPERRYVGKVLRALGRWSIIALAATVVCGSAAVATRDSSLQNVDIPRVQIPSLEELNTSIALAEGYLEGLYKPIGDGEAVQSEYYGLPIRAYFPLREEWVLLGAPNTAIEPLSDAGVDEQYRLSLGDTLVVLASITWSSTQYLTVSLQPEIVQEPVAVWLGDKELAAFAPDDPALLATVSFGESERGSLQSLRYTVRHATQEAYLYRQAKGDTAKAERLKKFLHANGYAPGFDMRAIIFNRSIHLPDDLPFNSGAYEDCDHLPQGSSVAYPYESKACKLLQAYLGAGERDPFLQAAKALHVLQKYAPNHLYQESLAENWWIQGSSPATTAQHLRKQWQRTGVGIPSCTPLSCTATASSIRTFTYGTLELELGARLGDTTAVGFADAAARSAVDVQIKQDGVVRMQSGPAYRPAHIGSFPVYWDNRFQFVPPSAPMIAGAALVATGQTLMEPEYMGILPSNSESTFDGWAFLVRYRCLRYNVGCIL